MKIISQQSYLDASNMNEGVNKDYYSTYLHTMNATEYLDYIINNKYQNAKFLKDVDQSEDVLNQLKEYNKLQYEREKQTADLLNQQGSVVISVIDGGVSTVRKQYTWGQNKLEFSTAITNVKSNLESKITNAINIVSTKANHDKEFELAKDAVTVVKNDNDLLPLKGEDKTLILYAYASHEKAIDMP